MKRKNMASRVEVEASAHGVAREINRYYVIPNMMKPVDEDDRIGYTVGKEADYHAFLVVSECSAESSPTVFFENTSPPRPGDGASAALVGAGMSDTFPTTSSRFIEVESGSYDLTQLAKAVQAVVGDQQPSVELPAEGGS